MLYGSGIRAHVEPGGVVLAESKRGLRWAAIRTQSPNLDAPAKVHQSARKGGRGGI